MCRSLKKLPNEELGQLLKRIEQKQEWRDENTEKRDNIHIRFKEKERLSGEHEFK